MSLLFCHNPPRLSHDSLCPRPKLIQDVKQRKKKGRGGSAAHARGGRGKKAAVTLSMVTRVDKVTPEQAGFSHVRCAFIDPSTGERCGLVKEWDQKAIKDLRPGGNGAWVAVVGTHQPTKNGKRLHGAAFEPWRKTGEAVDAGACVAKAEGVKYLSAYTASTMVTGHQTTYLEFLASEA